MQSHNRKDKSRPKVAMVWLSGCAGCETALLSIGRPLVKIYEGLDIESFYLVEDRSLDDSLDTLDYLVFTGAIATKEQLEMVKKGRERAKRLIALGTCATHGGIPAMANKLGMENILKETNPSIDRFYEGLPSFLPHLMALDEAVKVDLLMPGCPPHGRDLREFLKAMTGKGPRPPGGKSVCDQCHMERHGRFESKTMRRFLPGNFGGLVEKADGGSGRCLLEQGYLCLGPVTLSGCGSMGPPLCLKANVPCRGCYGPVRGCENQLLGICTILATHGVRLEGGIVDPSGVNRFIGAHGIYSR